MINWITGRDDSSLAGRVVSVGSYDGVHEGHRHVIRRMSEVAHGRNLEVLIASFDPHPRTVLHGQQESRLTSIEERGGLLTEVGVDAFVTLAFDHELASMSPEVFVERVLLGCLNARVVVVGHDHRFGRNREGDVQLLRSLGSQHAFDVVELAPRIMNGSAVSSSRIRKSLKAGEVASAASMLGRFHAMSGRVIRGAGRGRTIGIPTANLDPVDSLKIIPQNGVYAVQVFIPERSSALPGMMNIGRRPTFEGEGRHLEVNIIDWSGDLYGHEVRVEFVERIRNEQKFDGVEALIRQLKEDRERCSALLQGIS